MLPCCIVQTCRKARQLSFWVQQVVWAQRLSRCEKSPFVKAWGMLLHHTSSFRCLSDVLSVGL